MAPYSVTRIEISTAAAAASAIAVNDCQLIRIPRNANGSRQPPTDAGEIAVADARHEMAVPRPGTALDGYCLRGSSAGLT